MNTFIKHLLCLGLLSYTGLAIANDSNPNSAGYHARNNASSVYYQGLNGAANQQQAAPQFPPQPTGYWVKTWGAVAADGITGILGTAIDQNSKKDAERVALTECQAKGGNCTISLAYYNQCVDMVLGVKNYNSYGAATIEEAEMNGLKACNASDTNCRVYYSACTEPRFVKY